VEQLHLDREGFELHPCDLPFARYDDDRAVRGELFEQVAQFVRTHVGARRVHVFDYNIRTRTVTTRTASAAKPVWLVHTDYTVASGPQRVRDLLPDEAEALLERRFAFYNLWKPIRRRVEELPLAMCDARSVAPEDCRHRRAWVPDPSASPVSRAPPGGARTVLRLDGVT
jgi:hypothetical protein